MNSNNTLACPLDCFDACEAVLIDGNIKANKKHPTTKSSLCINFANLLNEEYLNTAFIGNKKVNLEEALETLVQKLKETKPQNTLYYKGAGNLGMMQNAPKAFFGKYGSVSTKGSLCDGAGDEGIVLGRGKDVNPPIKKLIDSDVIIVWGRNFSVTSPHMYKLVKDKIFITIDPISTPIAKKSEIHFQINPKTDHELALLFTRFAYMEDLEDEEFIKNHGSGADWFFDLAKSKPLVSYEKTTGISLSDVSKMFEIIKGKSVSIVLGIGVQKYYEGANITRTIDSFAAYIGLHNKQKGGLWYLDDSSYSYEKKFEGDFKKKISLPQVDFGNFDLVFIQGANPVVSAPNTQKVIDGLKNSYVVFFGTTFNDTCKYADLIIPASNFKTKKDVRLSYGHEYKSISYDVEQAIENSISEYEFTKYMNEKFAFDEIISEDEAFSYYKNKKIEDNSFIEQFEFIEELEVENLYEQKQEEDFYLIFRKKRNNLNSQFKIDNFLYLNPNSGYEENKEVIASTKYGQAKFIIKYDEDIKSNCIALYAGNKNANYLSPFKSDESSFSAIYQEVLVKLELS